MLASGDYLNFPSGAGGGGKQCGSNDEMLSGLWPARSWNNVCVAGCRPDEGSAGKQFVLLFAVHFMDDPYTFIDAYDSAVQTKIIVLRIAKLLS